LNDESNGKKNNLNDESPYVTYVEVTFTGYAVPVSATLKREREREISEGSTLCVCHKPVRQTILITIQSISTHL